MQSLRDTKFRGKVIPLEQPKHDGLIASTSSPLTGYTAWTKVGLINLDGAGKGAALCTNLPQTMTKLEVDIVDRTHRYASQTSCVRSRQIKRVQPDNLPKFSLANFTPNVISVFTNNFRSLAPISVGFAS